MSAIDLVAALQTRGCPACNHLERVTFDFFCHFQLSLATQTNAQQRFAEQHGLCPKHTWQLAAIMAPQSLCGGLPPLLERASAELGSLAAEPLAAGDRLADWFVTPRRCEVCGLLRQAENDLTARLAAFVEHEAGQAEYAHSQGVCLCHLDKLLGATSAESVRQFLLREAARRFTEIAQNMRGYAAKYEALKRAFATEDEKDAHRRALVHLVGDRWLCLP